MHYIKECGRDEEAVLARIRSKYGNNYTLLSSRQVFDKKWLGMYWQQRWRCTFLPHKEGEAAPATPSPPGQIAIPSLLPAETSATKIFERLASMENCLLDRLGNVERRLDQLTTATGEEDNFSQHLSNVLRENEFADELSTRMINSLIAGKNFSSRLEVTKQIGLQIQSLLRFHTVNLQGQESDKGPQIITLIGASGVGKTTTVAKLAAQFAHISRGICSAGTVYLVSLDNYRIGASQQIQAYGKILNLPVTSMNGYTELLRLVDRGTVRDIILIDTIGRNPHDRAKIADMQKVLSACGEQEIFLLLNSGTSYRCSKELLQCYQPLAPSSIILSKFDETSTIGPVLSAAIEADMPISYITNGPAVPSDMLTATPERVLEKFVTPNIKINWADVIRQCESKYLYRTA